MPTPAARRTAAGADVAQFRVNASNTSAGISSARAAQFYDRRAIGTGTGRQYGHGQCRFRLAIIHRWMPPAFCRVCGMRSPASAPLSILVLTLNSRAIGSAEPSCQRLRHRSHRSARSGESPDRVRSRLPVDPTGSLTERSKAFTAHRDFGDTSPNCPAGLSQPR